MVSATLWKADVGQEGRREGSFPNGIGAAEPPRVTNGKVATSRARLQDGHEAPVPSRPRTHAGARILLTHVHGSSGAARGAEVTRNLTPASFPGAPRWSAGPVLLGAQAPLPGPPPCLTSWSASVYQGRVRGSRLGPITSQCYKREPHDRGKYPRVGVTSDGADNAPRLRVTCGEDSKESAPPLKRRANTHTASAQDSSTPVPS